MRETVIPSLLLFRLCVNMISILCDLSCLKFSHFDNTITIEIKQERGVNMAVVREIVTDLTL